MSNDKMRAEFEAEYLKDVSDRYRGCEASDDEWVARGSNGEYRSFRAAGAWWGWQASREALVIELPKGESLFQRMYGVVCERPLLIERTHAITAIEAAGLKVSP